ncbi:ThiF family adenylyltransferase [Geomesophilobacter sediminis]|uniref:ThiF family adenylyltransferase n=1 Tax=Geomesophilobacter sediminis TaxID=2798584 RepID=A0A8J7IPD4_9BACT|nr:ThiF family adenylyltransferase [Geomesophilobacter sediminis]MBJ6724189.1 ThiF family adenylyltransferase [Geomesophilobacter sediminis]
MGRDKKNATLEGGMPVPPAIAQAVKELETFPDIVSVGEPDLRPSGWWKIATLFRVPMPSKAEETGISSTGVKTVEPVYMYFPENFPLKAPKFFLRVDFPRTLPHINPGSGNSIVSPCIYDGSLDDLLHQGHGLTTIIDQMQDWLRKAASDSLINKNQGWEPMRLDTADEPIIYQKAKVQGFVSKTAGFRLLTCDVFKLSAGDIFKISDYTCRAMDAGFIKEITQKDFVGRKGSVGTCPVLCCWPNESVVVDTYFPETVTNLGELLEKSKLYGTYQSFWPQIQLLWNQSAKVSYAVEVVTIHCVRRPLNLINQNTNLEFLSYRVRVQYTPLGIPDMNSPVGILGHLHAVGPELLREISGASPGKMESIIHIGCGSLGSKIALHLCRAGHGPFTLIDHRWMSEHNLARHALTTAAGDKAELLKKVMENFSVSATAHNKSLQDYLAKSSSRLFEKESLIIDSTASLNVRETLASLPNATNNSRIFQTGLYSKARLGFITIEGRGRNPRVDDLSAALFDSAIDDKPLSEVLAVADDAFNRQATGQGCGSYTTIIPDTRISLHAAAMAERARQVFEGDIPEEGEVSLGFLDAAGMSLRWQTSALAKTRRVRLERKDWELRVLAPAFGMMENEVARWPTVETGGVLIGRLCLTRKCAIVTRILEAPPDSTRSRARFELGVEGLENKIAEIVKSSGLTYLGTWHSHLFGGTPSGIDEATLQKIKDLRLGIPAFNLIWHGGELTCFADYGDY